MQIEKFASKYNSGETIKSIANSGKFGSEYNVRKLLKIAKSKGLIHANISNVPRDSVKSLLGKIKPLQARKISKSPGTVRRYIFTCAQNNTAVHEGLWNNLQVLADHYSAEIHVSRFTYIKHALGAKGDKKNFDTGKKKKEKLDWDDKIKPYISDKRLRIAKDLVWCGEMNILPTASRPLKGLEVYTRMDSGIFPHTKISMESVPSNKYDPAKFCYTTGSVTLRNYIHRKEGLKAEFHHTFGALLVEVDENDLWFARQLNADDSGTIYDFDICVKNGVLTKGNSILAVTWGDIHVATIDETVKETIWGSGGMLDTLKPQYQFLHDVLDFRGRSHHEIKDPHAMFKRFVSGEENVEKEVVKTAKFIMEDSYRSWCSSVVVDSNHHHHLGRWLKEQNGILDPVNAMFWLKMQQRVFKNIHEGKYVNYLEEAIREVTGNEFNSKVKFLKQDETFTLKDIEFGIHGDIGPGGSRGSPISFARMGRKINIGHHHGKAGILDGVYIAGLCGTIVPDWVVGPDSWSHSQILVYPNGKRTIVTIKNGKYRLSF